MNATNHPITLTADTIHNLANLAQDHFDFGTLISCYLDIRLNHAFYDRLWREHSLKPTALLVARHSDRQITEQEFSKLLNQEIKRFYEIAAECVTEDFDIGLEKAAKVFELASIDSNRESASKCDDCVCAECVVDCAECDDNRCRKVDGGCPISGF